MWRTISGFAKFSWALLAWWGRILVGAVGLIAAGAGAFGTPEQQQQQNKLIVLLSVAKWYWWVILALSVALCIVLIRSYLLVELRTLGLRIFEDRSSMQHALGSLEQELEEVERVWMICLAGSTLSANPSLFAKIDRVILPDLETEPRSRYMETFIMHSGLKTNLRELALAFKQGNTEVRRHRYPPFSLLIANPNSRRDG